ncbi:MAG: ribosomal protein S18-alanine N-acetyltransferase [bacterium]
MLLSKEQVLKFKNSIISIGSCSFGNETRGYIEELVLRPDSQFTVFAAIEENELTGFLILLEMPEIEEVAIAQIAVKKEMQSKGIGDLLVKEIIEHSCSIGIEWISLEVRVSNAAAIRLYEKNGFKKLGVRKWYYINPVEDAFTMVKKITPYDNFT